MTKLYDPDAERALVGAALLDASVLDLVELPAESFLDLALRRVWAAMLALHVQDQPIDAITAAAQAQVPPALLSECALATPTAANAEHYAAIVREHALTRAVLAASAEVADLHRLGKAAGGELLGAALQAFTRIDLGLPGQAIPIGEVIKQRFRELAQIADARERGELALTGVPTGIDALDDVLGGLQPGIVTILAGRPGMGKSALALGITDAASARGHGVHVFSLEDPRAAYADRTLAQAAHVPAERLRAARLDRGDFSHLIQRSQDLGHRTNWLYEDVSGIGAEELVRAVRRQRAANKTKLVVIDYLQLLRRPRRYETMHDAVTQNIETLAEAAKHDGIAYLVLAQLSRQVERREDKRPQPADLRESGSIEERAKCILFLYRGSVYGEPRRGIDYDQDEPPPSPEDWERRIDIIIAKNSNGSAGTYVRRRWDGPTTRVY